MLVLAFACLLLLAACGSGGGSDSPTAADPGGVVSASGVPAAPGLVGTRHLVTVMDTGTPELCVGPVAESWPPQCSGPRIAGWDWGDHPGTFEHQGATRWGEYAVQGTWDGSTLTYRGAIPAASYDPAAEPPASYPAPADHHAAAELQRIADELADTLPGAQTAGVDGQHVVVDVVYDDGSLQDQVDRAYGDGVVVLVPQLVDVEG